VGFYATADASQPIRIDLDEELAGKQHAKIKYSIYVRVMGSLRYRVRRTVVHPRGSARGSETPARNDLLRTR